MNDPTEHSRRVFVLANDEQFPLREAVWGTGGWDPPQQREAADWLVLARTLGWKVITVGTGDVCWPRQSLAPGDTVVVGCDPSQLSEGLARQLEESFLRVRFTLIFRVSDQPPRDTATLFRTHLADRFTGRRLDWCGQKEAIRWTCKRSIPAVCLDTNHASRTLATLDGRPVVTEQTRGQGRVVQLGFHPSIGGDQSGHCVALLRRLLTSDPYQSSAWFDWSETMILRMDDPGGSQNIYHKRWCYQKLDRSRWRAIGGELEARQARLSVGYVSGWVDDGDANRGTLWVDGERVARRAGSIYASPRVRYLDRGGHLPGTSTDCGSEYRGLTELASAGLVGIELHGFTHLHPDLKAWRRAADRYENQDWFRDFSPTAHDFLRQVAAARHPIRRGMRWIEQYFGAGPLCLICPGDEWSHAVLEFALQSPLQLVSSYYLAIRQSDRFVWSNQICAPYLDEPADRWFDAGLPVVGYFHDYELATDGVGWFSRQLDRWREAGARRFIDFRETAAVLATTLSLEFNGGVLTLHANQPAGQILRPRPVPVRLRITAGSLPEYLPCRSGEQEKIVRVHRESDREGRVWLPSFSD